MKIHKIVPVFGQKPERKLAERRSFGAAWTFGFPNRRQQRVRRRFVYCGASRSVGRRLHFADQLRQPLDQSMLHQPNFAFRYCQNFRQFLVTQTGVEQAFCNF